MAHEDWKAALGKLVDSPGAGRSGQQTNSQPQSRPTPEQVRGFEALERERSNLEQAVLKLKADHSRLQSLLMVTRSDLGVAETRLRGVESDAENIRHQLLEQEESLDRRLKDAAKDLERLEGLDGREGHIAAREERVLKDEGAISALEKELCERQEKLAQRSSAVKEDRKAFDRDRAALEESMEAHRAELARLWEIEPILASRENRIKTLSQELAFATEREEAARAKGRKLAKQLREQSEALAIAESALVDERKARNRSERAEVRWREEAEAATQRIAETASLAIGDETILRWLASLGTREDLGLSDRIGFVGTGPWLAATFKKLLSKQGFKPCQLPNPSVEVVLVGRDGWTEEALDEHLFDREGKGVRFYSFEMFLMYLATGVDPFDGDKDVLLAFADGHPALEFLQTKFEWPFTMAATQSLFEWDGQQIDESPLVVMGYHVGKVHGLPPSQRRRLLASAFEGPLQWQEEHSEKYRTGWGSPRSRRRLCRIARHIAMLARQRIGMQPQRHAVGDWKADLDWLKATYWRRAMGFRWPSVAIK